MIQCRRHQSSGPVRAQSGLARRSSTWTAPKAEETRRRLYDRAVADKVLIAGFHYPFPSLGHAEKDGTGYRLVPIAWNPVL